MANVCNEASQLAQGKSREHRLTAHEEASHIELLKHQLRQLLLIGLQHA